jgi:hypothetical protein
MNSFQEIVMTTISNDAEQPKAAESALRQNTTTARYGAGHMIYTAAPN